ncbi:MAG: ribose-phosphate pyrophosphokinase [Nitrospirae bacterium]|nr:ribose-phosphate pyrophosphokinase [Nitrospirota bacterium]
MVKAKQGMKIFTGNANPGLAKEICDRMNIPLGNAVVSRFSDGEINVQIMDNVRGCDVFVVQPTASPVNRHLMELLIMIDAFKRASAARITAVLPYYGYSRQDRKVQPRVPITAKLVADLITTAGANRVLTIDLHAGQIQGFFNIPVDNLFAASVLLDYLRTKKFNNLTLVSPDAGGVERTRAFAKRLNASLAIIDKRRERHPDRGRGGAQERRRRDRRRGLHPRGAVGPGHPADQRIGAGRGDRHEHDRPGQQEEGVREADGPFRGPGPRRGDEPDPRGDVAELAVRLAERQFGVRNTECGVMQPRASWAA